MKLHFILSLLVIPVLASSAPHPQAKVKQAAPDKDIQPAIVIEIVRDGGVSDLSEAISIRRSSAADSAGRYLTITAKKNGEETTVPVPPTVYAPDGDQDGWAKIITIPLAETDTETSYKIELRPSGSAPALTYRVEGREIVEQGPLVLEAGAIEEDDLENSPSLQRSLEFGGGEDGSLLSLRARYGGALLEDHDYARWFARLDADLSAGEDASESLIYGRVDAEIDALARVPFPEGGYFKGSVWLGLNATYKSDQDFDNWDATTGLASWWFVNADAIQFIGDVLRISKDKQPVHPLALKISADYVYASEREAGTADPEDIQFSARLIWMNRIYTKTALPLMDARFHINLFVDIGATWEPESASVHPETRLSLEFQPEKFEDANLAFALTWAKGQFSPTFADEDAFLAGLKWRF